MSISYTDPTRVEDVRVDKTARPNPYALGYGAKIPTAGWVKYLNRWRRVYVMCYGNSGSAYIIVKGEDLFLDTDTRYWIMENES